MDWFYIALISPALWAVVCLIDDNLMRDAYPSPIYGAVISGIMSLLPVFTVFFIKIDTAHPKHAFFALLGGMVFTFSYVFYFKALKSESPSVTLALWNLASAFLPLFAFIFLGEILSKSQYLGVMLIITASFLLAMLNVKQFKFSKAFYLMISASMLTATSSLTVKYAYAQLNFWSGFIYYSIGLGLGAVLLLVSTQKGRQIATVLKGPLRKYIGLFLFSELINVAAVLNSNLAISKGPVAAVKVMEGIVPLYLLTIAWLLHRLFPTYFPEGKDKGKLKKYLLMGVMVAGLYFIHN